jgi:hypothetical protein
MNNSLYMLRCPGRSYFARYTVILITSRDFAILLLYRCLRHSHTKHELRTIFHHLNSFKSDRNVSDCTFWKFSYKRKISFLFISCTRNRHSTMIENYIRRDDVIKCELDRLALIEIWFTIELSQITVAKRVDYCHEMIQITFASLCREVVQIALTDLCHEVIQIALTDLCHEMIQIAFTDLCRETR